MNVRSRNSWIAWAAVALVLAVGVGACGGDDDKGSTSGSAPPPGGDSLKGQTVRLWIMPNGPDPKNDIDKLLDPFEAKTGITVDTEIVGWDVMQDRIRNAAVSGEGPDITQAGTTQVPFFAALQGFEDLSGRVEDIGGSAAYPKGVWSTTQVVGPGRHVGRAVVHRGPRHLLPQGRPEAGGRRGGGRVRRLGRDDRHAAGDQGQGAGDRRQADPAVRLARQEGLRPRPPRDAVRVGRRRRRALRGQHEVDDRLARGAAGRRVLRRPAAEGPLRQEPAPARRHAGREPVQGRPHRRLDGRPVDVRLDRARRRRELGARGARERGHRAHADRAGRQRGLHVRRRLEPDDVQVGRRTRTPRGRS